MPFDNIKTRMQSSNQVTRSMYSCAGEILRSGGISGFWKGTSPRLIRLTVSVATERWVATSRILTSPSFQAV